VLIADDHPVVRDGLRFVIGRAGRDIEIVGEAADGLRVLELVDRIPVDVVILDITMPRLNGLDAARELVRRHPRTKILFLSLHSSPALVEEALGTGGQGYLTKATAGSHVAEAVRRVHAGRLYLSPDVAPLVAQRRPHRRGAVVPRSAASLTQHERQVLQLIVEGRTTREIAADLGRAVETVRSHRRNLMAKLGVHKETTLVRVAVALGITKVES
jgi:two-component system, NarL family, response regulator NreC